MNAQPIKNDNDIRNWHAFEGPLGDILHNGRSFFAWKEGRLIGLQNSRRGYGVLAYGRKAKDTGEQMKRFRAFVLSATIGGNVLSPNSNNG